MDETNYVLAYMIRIKIFAINEDWITLNEGIRLGLN